jgi:repressor LexA
MSLTARQNEILEFIADTHRRDGVVPSSREIQQHFGFASQTAAMNHLRALERKGAIRRRPGKARAVSVVSAHHRGSIVDIPIYGGIAAGRAELTQQENVGTISLDAATAGLSRGSRPFAVKVRGDSMIGAQINDGDLVILEPRPPKPGDIVVALIDGETTLKRYLTKDGAAFLKAENPAFPDLHPAEELIIQGVMVALIRRQRES